MNIFKQLYFYLVFSIIKFEFIKINSLEYNILKKYREFKNIKNINNTNNKSFNKESHIKNNNTKNNFLNKEKINKDKTNNKFNYKENIIKTNSNLAYTKNNISNIFSKKANDNIKINNNKYKRNIEDYEYLLNDIYVPQVQKDKFSYSQQLLSQKVNKNILLNITIPKKLNKNQSKIFYQKINLNNKEKFPTIMWLY